MTYIYILYVYYTYNYLGEIGEIQVGEKGSLIGGEGDMEKKIR